ncbi:MAG: radical SAM protein, partial [Caldilineaceae bacterium]|nr:radical SAM protein [Caldilineaceae bacterium]
DRDGLAQRGVLLRHLIMPGCIEDSKAIMRFVAKELSTHTYVNLMDQYYPAGKVDVTRYAALNRCITRDEYEEVLAYAQRVGLRRFDTRHAGYHWTQ